MGRARMRVDGQKMRTRREELLLERSELAARLSVSYTTIYKMEVRGHLPRLSTVKAIARVLKLRPEEMLVSSEAPLERKTTSTM